jgi:NADP-dependent 3-hydroxy acid dehydrogenase YdfG
VTGGALTGRVAVVSGAARGIGLAVAEALHAQGAQVWLVARSAQALQAQADRLGTGAVAHPADLTLEDACHRLVAEVLERSGRLDVLVHSAGTIHLGTVQDTPPAVLREQLESNVVSAYALVHAALPALLAAEGDVVVIGSSVGRLPGPAGKAHYAASQHALRAFTESLREEVNARGVRVALVLPGQTATERQERLHVEAGRAYAAERLLQPADVAAVAVGAVLLPRTAELTEVAVRPRVKP